MMTKILQFGRHASVRPLPMIRWLAAAAMLVALGGTSHARKDPVPDRKKAMVTEPGTAPTREQLRQQKLLRDARTRPNQLNPQPLPPEPPEAKRLNPQPVPPKRPVPPPR
jgi:hypothetical protein